MFLTPVTITELATRREFYIFVRHQVAQPSFFFQTWNFELKFFVDDPFMQKIISIGVGSHFFPKKYLEGPKTQIQKLY